MAVNKEETMNEEQQMIKQKETEVSYSDRHWASLDVHGLDNLVLDDFLLENGGGAGLEFILNVAEIDRMKSLSKDYPRSYEVDKPRREIARRTFFQTN